MQFLRLARLASIPATMGTLLALAHPVPASATAGANSGFYDHQIIEYQATAEVTSSPQAAQLISKGNVVFHVVGADGTTPAVQCARLLAALPTTRRAATCSTSSRLKWATPGAPGICRSSTGTRESPRSS